MDEEFISQQKACLFFGVNPSTLRRWDKENKIKTIRTPSNYRRYNITSYVQDKNSISNIHQTKSICYCRVSSKKQSDDLDRQISYLKTKYPTYDIISDVGSGINFKRKGLCSLLEQVCKGNVNEVIVAYKDRLCRFGFDLIEWICKLHNTKIVVLNQTNNSSEQELSEDIMSIIHVFSCKQMGKRKYKIKVQTN